MNQSEINTIKNKRWDFRVKRPGYFQSKQIVTEAIVQKIMLTNSVSVFEKSNLWINSLCMYDQDGVDNLLNGVFERAFKEKELWPLKFVKELDVFTKEKDSLVKSLSSQDLVTLGKNRKLKLFEKYVNLLKDIQKYYAFAVPLTNYCEKELSDMKVPFHNLAVQYKTLDVDKMNTSLLKIKKTFSDKDRNKLIKTHLKRFAWIKSNYNLLEDYTKEEVLNEIKSDLHTSMRMKASKSKFGYLITALQVGIYLRNRMKEMSQQIWFAFDGLATDLSETLDISKDEFLQMHYKEIIDSIRKGKLSVSKKVIADRKKGFVTGYLNAKEVSLTGEVVKLLERYFDGPSNHEVREINGTVACKGVVTGVVKNISTIKEACKLSDGDILVTPMTTPDFVVFMKKAGAIVTDEGGLSCHAAIVSREMNKPCIIGTKIATKVLKDGDMVEVDAEKGVVKVIK